MNTLLAILAAINLVTTPAAKALHEDHLVCKSIKLQIPDFLVIQVTCNGVIGPRAAIEFAYSYVQTIGKGDHERIYAIVAGGGNDPEIEYSTVWSIGFSK